MTIPAVSKGSYFGPALGNLDWATLHDQRAGLLAMLLPRNFDNFVLAPKAAENPDLALGDAEMLSQ